MTLLKEIRFYGKMQRTMDDIGIGGTVIYSSIHDKCYKMSKVRKKNDGPRTLGLENGDTIQLGAIVDTTQAAWNEWKDKKIVKEASEVSAWKKLNALAKKNHGQGFATLDEEDMAKYIDLKKANKLAEKLHGEFGFATLDEKEMEKLINSNLNLIKALKESKEFKIDFDKSAVANLAAFAGKYIKPGRVVISGYPVDIEDGEDEDQIELSAVDKDAATRLIKLLRAAQFKATRYGDTEFSVKVQKQKVKESKNCRTAEELNEGDAVEITGNVEFKGEKGIIVSFGQGKKFVIVKIGKDKHSFHCSDVSETFEDLDEGVKPSEGAYHLMPTTGVSREKFEGKKHDFAAKVTALHGRPIIKQSDGKTYYLKQGRVAAKYDNTLDVGYVYSSSKEVKEGWEKRDAKSQERKRDDNKGKRIRTPDGEGVVEYETKEPTFSQMVPFIQKFYVKLDSGQTKSYRNTVCTLIKTPGPAVKEDAELAKKLVRGEKSAPGILNKINQFVTWKLFFNKDKNRFLPARQALEQLRKAGFNEDQIYLVRDIATKAAKTALEKMMVKYPKQIVEPGYHTAMDTSFQVFELFLNVSDEIRSEFADLFQELFDRKIEKVKSELNLIKEEAYTDFEDWKQAVLSSYPQQAKKMKFKGRMEGGKDTISAEVPGEDRSYGVWDGEKEKGVVLSEGPIDSVKGFVKHQSNMAKANAKGWGKFGDTLQAGFGHRDAKTPEEKTELEKKAKQSVRDGNRYRDFADGGKGFNSSRKTTRELKVDAALDKAKTAVKGVVGKVKQAVGMKEGFSPYKPNTKVTIIGGPKDVVGKEGTIGEVKTVNGKKSFVVDYDHDFKSNKPNFGAKSVELDPKHIKLCKTVKEEKQEEQFEVINKAHADNGTAKKVFFTGSREECYEFMRSHKSLKMDLMYKESGRLASYKL